MTQNSIVFSFNERCSIEAFKLWQKRDGIMRKSYLFLLCSAINLCAAVLTFLSMYFEEEFSVLKAVLLILLETVLLTFLTVRTVKEKIVPEMAKNSDIRFKNYSDKTQITLREEDFEIKTEYKLTNYYYDEIKYCVDKGNFCFIVIDEHVAPIVIPFISTQKGSKDNFSAFLKDKLGEKYERGV